MRFYIDLPLVVGYSLMATAACLGMLQFAAARGGYAGLSLFSRERTRGLRIGAMITIAALLLYMSFAPEIRTPGPAGTEVAEMFAACAAFALAITLIGADVRLHKQATQARCGGEPIKLGPLSATAYYPSLIGEKSRSAGQPDRVPAIVMVPDPSAFVIAPPALLDAFMQADVATIVLDSKKLVKNDLRGCGPTLVGHVSMALADLGQQPGIDHARLGLLGLGLGGDAAIRVAASRHDIRATLAVSPVSVVTTEPKQHESRLCWLREMSLREARRWRRLWPTLRDTATTLSLLPSEPGAVSAEARVVYASGCFLTTRNTPGVVEDLPVSSTEHFTFLGDTHARELVVTWLRDALAQGVS